MVARKSTRIYNFPVFFRPITRGWQVGVTFLFVSFQVKNF